MQNNYNQTIELENENSIVSDEKGSKLIQLLESPWKLIKDAGSFGIRGVKRMATIVVVFSFTNIALFFYALASMFSNTFDASKLSYLMLVTAIGFAITFYAGYRAYQFLLVNALSAVYKSFTPLFEKLCAKIIDKAEIALSKKENLTNPELSKAIDYGHLVNEHYNSLPGLLKSGANIILNKIPFRDMLLELNRDIKEGNKEDASIKLFMKADGFINEYYFGKNNTKWVYWLLPLNIIIQVLIVKFKIG